MLELQFNQVIHGDCLEVLRTLPDDYFSSIVTDPPYGLGQHEPTPEELIAYLMGAELKTGDFMNKPWDLPPVSVWKECFRVLKPGGYLLAFAGTRTFDLMSIGIRMAGFENRDTIDALFGPDDAAVLQWMHGQGFPKSHNVGAKIDKKLGMKREVVGTKKGVGGENLNDIVKGREVRQTTDEGGKGVGAYGVGAKQVAIDIPVTAPASDEAKKWEGWGNNLKPAWEPILMFRKPLAEKSIVDQVLTTGTGAINIDATRIRSDGSHFRSTVTGRTGGMTVGADDRSPAAAGMFAPEKGFEPTNHQGGRWPANVLLVHGAGCKVVGTKKVKAPVINRFDDGMKPFGEGAGHEYTSTQTGDENGEEEIPIYECMDGCPCKVLDSQSGTLKSGVLDHTKHVRHSAKGWSGPFADDNGGPAARKSFGGDSGGASRFFMQFEPDAPFYYCGKASAAEKRIEKPKVDLLQVREDLSVEDMTFLQSELQRLGLV